MKLTFWVARSKSGCAAFDIREKTKKECLSVVAEIGHSEFDPPEKVVLEFRDSFDLLDSALGEGGYHTIQIN